MALSVRGSATARLHTPAHASTPPLLHPAGVPVTPGSACGWSHACGRSSHRHARKLARSPLRHASSGRLVCGATATSGLGLFPSGIQQARVQLPAVVLQIEASQLLSDASAIDLIGQALQGGCNMVVLWDSASNAAAMYDAALRVQEVLRGRAALLLVDRTDIALAIGAQGVLLTDQGVPTVVAKRMMSGGSALIGRLVLDERAAVTAAADGASLIVVTGPGGTAPSPAVLAASRANQISGSAIPLLLGVRAAAAGGPALAAALEAEVDGVAFSIEALPAVARACFDLPGTAGVTDFTTAILTRLNVKAATAGTAKRSASAASATATAAAAPEQQQQQQAEAKAAPAPEPGPQPSTSSPSAAAPSAAPAPRAPPAGRPAPAASPSPSPAPSARSLRRLLDPEREALVADEKAALAEMLGFLDEALPGVSELSLLRDALKALDEPFLVAVVGEFNSGKSSVINALLGRRYLAEGILPTTNEISILRYSAAAGGSEQLQQQADGLFVRYLPAKLLQDLNIVDTPGTNVILERQQRLTEEYVPRADLVLFVMSADRPLSESEVRFLEYIRQWQKKVVFVLNKADILEGPAEVEAVRQFVAANAQRILRLDRPAVIAVSSRAALRSKLAAAGLSTASTASFDGSEPPPPASGPEAEAAEAALAASPDWAASNFSELERHMSNFLVGRGAGGGEGVRLKLQTPLFVADALLGAAGRQLATDLAAARGEVEGVQLVARQLERFRAEMDKDAAAQRAALQPVLAEVLDRAERFVDRTVQLSNAPMLLSIAAGNREYPFRTSFEQEVVGSGFDSLSAAVAEHSSWLRANCEAQVDYYRAFAAQRAAAAGVAVPASSPPAIEANSNGRADASDRASSGAAASSSSSAPAAPSPAARAVSDFNVRAVATLLDAELQGAMAGTAGTAVGAPLVGLFAMQVIQNSLEDVLVAGLTGAVSYVSLINLPLRRADLKGKISRVATNFLGDVQTQMAAEVEAGVGEVAEAVGRLMRPLQEAYGGEVARLEARQADLARFSQELQDLQRRTANLE